MSSSIKVGTSSDSNAVGTLTWSGPTSADGDDSSYATCSSSASAQSHYLKKGSLGFAIPTGATIDGISVSIKRKASGAGSIANMRDYLLFIVKADGTLGTENKAATTTDWPMTEGTATYGGATDKWSLTWTPANINDADFGFVLSVVKGGSSTKIPVTASVNYTTVTVYYTEAATRKRVSVTSTLSF